ncbi:MAG TPA: HAMP domain-containing sensor histidine kinase [Pyrinomonadaceae bacterium]|jgi:signal transduction histidine kinase|nr:HAMP domain-containing sensor histidine kinase [Pyrinomonadaceae bacterium]
MSNLRTFLKRHILWVGLAAVVVPLLSILGLQCWSLLKLEKTSIVAGKVGMKNYLGDVTKEVKVFYKTTADQVLDVRAYSIQGDNLHKTKYHFSKCEIEGAKRLFIAAFDSGGGSRMVFFNPHTQSKLDDVPPVEVRAAQFASAQLRMLAQEGTTVEKPMTYFEDSDMENRILFKPIIDGSSKVVGVAGMILDTDYFREQLLPRVIRETLPRFFPDGTDANVIVTAHDAKENVLFASQSVNGQDDKTATNLPYFWDYTVAIRSRHMTPEQWARWNFNFSLSLSLLMTGVLIGGIVLALRTASREMRLSRMKTDFVSNVSHELRTPLSSIRVFGEFMKLGRVRDDEKIREYGEHIETESRRLTQLINNILDFSKIESGRKTYQFERVGIEEVIAETLKCCEVRLRQNDFRIVFEGAASPLPPVVLDRDAVAQALMNLLDNAVKYSECSQAKEVVVRVGQKDGFVQISVADHGVGIPREEQKKIFEKFYRVSTGLVHDVKGSGLGLSLVKHIVEAHRGRVTVESEPGQGSTFTIHLPVAKTVGDSAETQKPTPLLGGDSTLGFGYKR